MKNLFITGFNGFFGWNLLRRMNPHEYESIYCISRNVNSKAAQFIDDKITLIKGNILEPESYASYLSRSDTVVHLAAITGKAKDYEYFNTNVKGLEVFLEQCRKYNIERFLYISSIAVKYQDISHYYYAKSKYEAEALLKKSNLNYTIIRPAIVLGPESPIWRNLYSLGKFPICVIFGKGNAKIQPIYIDDLINCINLIIREEFKWIK